MQFDVVTLFPEMFRALTDWVLPAGQSSRNGSTCARGILAISPRTIIEPLTIARMAVVPAW